jgi:hypothetical protein
MSYTTSLSPAPSLPDATGVQNFPVVPVSSSAPVAGLNSSLLEQFLQTNRSELWNFELNTSLSSDSVVSSISLNFPGAVVSPNWDTYAIYLPYLTKDLEGPDTQNNGTCLELLENGGDASCFQALRAAVYNPIQRNATFDFSGWRSIPAPKA